MIEATLILGRHRRAGGALRRTTTNNKSTGFYGAIEAARGRCNPARRTRRRTSSAAMLAYLYGYAQRLTQICIRPYTEVAGCLLILEWMQDRAAVHCCMSATCCFCYGCTTLPCDCHMFGFATGRPSRHAPSHKETN